VAAEAERWLGAPLSLDLFATAVNALVPSFFARFPEQLAEGVDALAQPVWGRSRRTDCGALHWECAFAFPPRSLLPAFVAKARADGLRGIVIAPLTPPEPVRPTVAHGGRRSAGSMPDPPVYGRVRPRGGGAGRRTTPGNS
jgi:hypothetical protein